MRLVLPVVALAVVGFLYYRPLASYVETRNDLGRRRAEVAALRTAKARLELRLEQSTSLVALSRAARRIGLVRPDQQLFIVKGIPAWNRAHRDTVSGDGRP